MSLSFRNRLAIYYMLATAIIIAVVFSIVYFIVERTVYQNLDNALYFEARKHTKEIKIKEDILYFINKEEWEEIEHKEVHTNPVFIQIIDDKGRLMDKSPNLKEEELPFEGSKKLGENFNTKLNNQNIRQVQIPIEHHNQIKGYIIAAMSLEDSLMVILNLRNTLLILFPIVLVGLFFVSRYLAGRSIIPIQHITNTTNRITKSTLNERVTLPPNKDELFDLSSSINKLLNRIENTLQREQQFTSDASHELRTPLATLRGTLEILIRKPRTQQEYEEKVRISLSEVDKMTVTLEQLLLLARFDTKKPEYQDENKSLTALIHSILEQHKNPILTKNLHVIFNNPTFKNDFVPYYYAHLIVDNIIRNAIKYSPDNSELRIIVEKNKNEIICIIKDQGIGIKKEDLEKVFIPFFRSDALNHKEIIGNGLGLSIAKKAAIAIQATITVESELNHGTTFTITFLSIS
ncbi:MAG: two-component sensor histidine kinase [Flavobacteriaceae bacterium CG_4_8_14_3_um_filter_34_10]|nr:two-component sensor histidine kinase [Flavobacteriia bacterium]OIP49865.1 MAG: two-component sensor histidine kinase [Flavobacteriaceae bacterium CG2_30_34_30]PIQ18843.1 MAG: two-component sensor histidine kinase [Flavobacteriaceae bacterium CG18_big_fil_WC_8_21_14_2_50_34_36]PIV50975.1 MAG: two-component sensor histidine kinase [Flavobacteriaceae bacterium CG02_land_8_20_14_3_00_34_13]PIX10515.1 MAG: two-component sensor histidine kinase [Flavobacteriaceae bacterium CG_4_8_14_3_um_filter_3